MRSYQSRTARRVRKARVHTVLTVLAIAFVVVGSLVCMATGTGVV